MSLLDLSDELLLQIISGDSPLDSDDIIYTTYRTCRRLHAIATTVRSNRLRCYKSWEHNGVRASSYILHQRRFQQYPERARMVHHASFHCDRPCDTSGMWDTLVDISSKLHQLRELRMLVGRRRTYPSENFQGIVHHLNSLRGVPNNTPNDAFMNSPFDDIRNLKTMVQSCSFDQLRTVVIEHEGVELQEILAFCALPAIRSLEVMGLRDYTLTTSSSSSLHSNLRRLDVSSTSMPTGAEVERFFVGLVNLRTLSWTAEIYPSDYNRMYNRAWSPADIRKALIPCQNTLKYLELIIKIDRSPTGLFPLDLTEFSRLSTIKINSRILFPAYAFPVLSKPDLAFAKSLPRSLTNLEVRSILASNKAEEHPLTVR